MGVDVKYIMSSSSRPPICDDARHDAMKVSFTEFQCKATILKRDPVFGFIWGNCKACGSTLTIPIEMEEAHYKTLRASEAPVDPREHI